MKRSISSHIATVATFAILTCLASRTFAVTTHANANGIGSPFSGLHVDYTVTVENIGSWLRYVRVYAQNSKDTFAAVYTGNLALQGPSTSVWNYDNTVIPSGSYYCGGDCQGNNASGQWFAGSNQVLIIIP